MQNNNGTMNKKNIVTVPRKNKISKCFLMIFVSLLIVFSSMPSYSKSVENLIYHIRERHDVNFMSPYQYVTSYKYLHRNDSVFMDKYSKNKSITIDDIVQFSHKKAKGVCFNQKQMETEEGRNKVFDYIEEIANMTDINDYWIGVNERKIVPVNVLQINGKRGGYNAIGVWIEEKDGLQTAFPDGYPDGNGSGVGSGMKIDAVRKYYLNTILVSEAKLKEEFNKSLAYVESALPSEFGTMIDNYNIEAASLINKPPKLLPRLNKVTRKRL